MILERKTIRSYEKGLIFKDGEISSVLDQGKHWIFNPLGKTRVDIVSMRDPWLFHDDNDLIISSGLLGENARIVDLDDNQRGLVWIDNRFERIIGPGQHVLWQGLKKIRVEILRVDEIKLNHPEMNSILAVESSDKYLQVHRITEGFTGAVYLDGDFLEMVGPGRHVFWKGVTELRVFHLDMRESTLDINGQEIITQDKVTLRMNGIVMFKVTEPQKALSEVEDYQQSLYREAQLALRSVVGTRKLDELLKEKESLAAEVKKIVHERAGEFGLQTISFGVKDIILPGDMKELLNKVVESQKVAEANLITRREETAAMRSQANTARLLSNNPTLMRLRELEVLEKIAGKSNLNILCGDSGIADKLVKLI